MNDIKEIMANQLIDDLESGCGVKLSKSDALICVEGQIQDMLDYGFVIVPEDVSPEMLKAGENSSSVSFQDQTDIPEYELDVTAVYEAMIEASQGGDV